MTMKVPTVAELTAHLTELRKEPDSPQRRAAITKVQAQIEACEKEGDHGE